MIKKDFWASAYRRILCPYLLREDAIDVADIPKWYVSLTGNKYIHVILNRNYKPISCVETVGWTTDGAEIKRPAHELVGSVVSFARKPEDFKNVWHRYPFLYDDGVGHNNKSVEDYLERLTKLFTHKHKFLTLNEIEELQEAIGQHDDEYRHLACDGYPNCDSMPELCQDYGHESQMIGHKD
tara:strand:+ start:49 stop:594 length:546 start_codon:yes stop_codon:yes gene_type:complete